MENLEMIQDLITWLKKEQTYICKISHKVQKSNK